MKDLTEVKVGDKLTVYTRAPHAGTSGHWQFRTAARVTATTVVDNLGWRWTKRGDRIGDGRYGYTRCSLFTPQDEVNADNARKAAEVRGMAYELTELKWREMPDEVIREAHAKYVTAQPAPRGEGRVG